MRPVPPASSQNLSVLAKVKSLADILEKLPGALVAFSGGADSAFLAEMAHRTIPGGSLAVTADSPSLPRRELQAAKALAASRAWRHRVVVTHELENPNYANNPPNRCYFCKLTLFERLRPIAEQLNVPILLGTNLSDLMDWRPGHRAADENGIRHPLVEAGFEKRDVRQASREVGLPTADKPASACLSSRFAYGVGITSAGLARVETAEDYILGCGFTMARVRDLGNDKARVEVGQSELGRLTELAPDIASRLRQIGFREVMIDERGYRPGSLNEGLNLGVRTP